MSSELQKASIAPELGLLRELALPTDALVAAVHAVVARQRSPDGATKLEPPPDLKSIFTRLDPEGKLAPAFEVGFRIMATKMQLARALSREAQKSEYLRIRSQLAPYIDKDTLNEMIENLNSHDFTKFMLNTHSAGSLFILLNLYFVMDGREVPTMAILVLTAIAGCLQLASQAVTASKRRYLKNIQRSPHYVGEVNTIIDYALLSEKVRAKFGVLAKSFEGLGDFAAVSVELERIIAGKIEVLVGDALDVVRERKLAVEQEQVRIALESVDSDLTAL